MEYMDMRDSLQETVESQREFFRSGASYDLNYRIDKLKKLYSIIEKNTENIAHALKEDLGKSSTESYMCEIGMTLAELSYQIKHIKKWSRERKVRTPLTNFHSKSFTVREPLGCVLVLSPWNYPFLLCMEPMIGAVAAGNCCIIQPSADAPASSAVVKKIVSEAFRREHVSVIEGGAAAASKLLDMRFDHIFYTGSVNKGRMVMSKAAENLTPVTLELGGKSPCIVTDSCDISLAAKRIAFGKFLNCGQTCVAPDYILVDKSIKEKFIRRLTDEITEMYGLFPIDNPDYGKIISQRHFDRIVDLMDEDKTVFGGDYDSQLLKIAPAVMDNVTREDRIMQEEIFGPVLPVIGYDYPEDAEAFIKEGEKPLALYIFTSDESLEKRFLKYVPFGGGCVNDTIVHLASPYMGFGGIGNSGMGSYHGKKSFDTFTHEKSIVKKYTWIDMPMRYQPYRKKYAKFIKKLMR